MMIRFFDQDGIDIAEPAQRKIERLYHREEFRRALASEIGDIGYAAARARALHRRAERHRRRRRHRPGRVQDGARLLLRDLQLRDAQRAGQAGRRGPGGEPLRRHRRGHGQRPPGRAPAHVADLVRASGAHLGAVIDPGGEHLTLVDDEGKVFTDDQALLLLLDLVVSTDPARQGGPARWRRPWRPSTSAPTAGAEIMWTKLSATHLMEVAERRRGHLRRQPDGRLHLPALPPRLRRRGHPRPPARHAGPHRRAPVEAGEPAARPSTSSTRRSSRRGSRRAR